MEDDTGSLRLALPPDMVRIHGAPGVSAQLATEPPTFAVEVHAAAAPDLQPAKPWTKGAIETWLLERVRGWTTAELTNVETSIVQLPAGEAIALQAQFRPNGPDLVEVVAYAIPSATGVADLQIFAIPEYWTTREDDLALIPRLLVLGD
jgi:hypothetical protein